MRAFSSKDYSNGLEVLNLTLVNFIGSDYIVVDGAWGYAPYLITRVLIRLGSLHIVSCNLI